MKSAPQEPLARALWNMNLDWTLIQRDYPTMWTVLVAWAQVAEQRVREEYRRGIREGLRQGATLLISASQAPWNWGRPDDT